MADIFISYAKEDRARIEPLAKVLAEQGWSVWWDRRIPAGRTWREVIGGALQAARAVIVAWSATSVKSTWVQEEADWGLERRLLVPIFLDDIRPPLGFGAVQAVDLSQWKPSQSSPRFDKLISDLELLLGSSPLKTKAAEQKLAQQEAKRKAAAGAKQREEERHRAEEERKQRQAEEDSRRKAAAKRKVEEETKRKQAEEKQRAEEQRKAEEQRRQKEQGARQEEEKRRLANVQQGKQQPGSKKGLLVGIVALVLAVVMVSVWYNAVINKRKFEEQYNQQFVEISEQLGQRIQEAKAVSSVDHLDEIINHTQDTVLLRWEELVSEASAAGMDIAIWEKRFRDISGHWQEVIETKRKELAANTQAAPETQIATLFIETTPTDSIIRFLNNDSRFQQGMQLEGGRYHLEVSAEGYQVNNFWVELEAGKEERMEIHLDRVPEPEPQLAKLFVQVSPENSTIKIMNIRPPFQQGLELASGEYHIQVSADDYEKNDLWVTLEPGQEKHLEIRLENKPVAQPQPIKGPDKAITNSIGMEFVYIPPGTYLMGSPKGEAGRGGYERQHAVTLTRWFYMQTTEVTQGQWQAVMGSNPSYFKECGADCPANYVSWNDVQDFIEELNVRNGDYHYRLPTEAEWEYACRAGTTTAFSFGNIVEELPRYAWYGANSQKQTHPVGRKKPNPWVLYDMHGNVWEWCQDWHGGYPHDKAADPPGPSRGSSRVIRGGSWDDPAGYCRAAFRSWYAPDFRGRRVGFRLVCLPNQ